MSFRGTLSRLKPRPPKEEHKRDSPRKKRSEAQRSSPRKPTRSQERTRKSGVNPSQLRVNNLPHCRKEPAGSRRYENGWAGLG